MADIKKILDEIKELTVVELNDLVKSLEEEFGVSAAAMAVAAPAAGAGAAATTIKTGTAVAKMARRGGMIMKLSAIPLWGKTVAAIVALTIATSATVAITTGIPKDETPDNAQLETQATTEPEKEGCGGVLTVGAVATMVLAGAWVTIAARKKEN